MSSVSKFEPEIREIYTISYRWVRQYRSGWKHGVPPSVAHLSRDHFLIIVFAMVSHDNSRRKMTAWKNPFRERHFLSVQSERYPELRIPF